MQCTLCYPTETKDANLRAITTLKSEFSGYPIGFSDHTLGTLIPGASILLGVTFIEKHYTFDKTLPESADHWLSLDEAELTQLVSDLRILEGALGSDVKEKKDCEDATHKFARRSLVAARSISKGSIITDKDLTAKRPGNGLAPVLKDRFLGLKALKDISEDEQITMDHAE